MFGNIFFEVPICLKAIYSGHLSFFRAVVKVFLSFVKESLSFLSKACLKEHVGTFGKKTGWE